MSNRYAPEKIFNMVVDHIDECILNRMSSKEICDALMENTGIHSAEFNVILRSLNFTYSSLAKYIPARRAYLALKYVINEKTKSINYVADRFGYNGDSVFSREIKKHFKMKPTEARKLKPDIKDNKLSLTQHEEELPTENTEREENNMNENVYEALKENRNAYYADLIKSLNEDSNLLDGDAIYHILQLADMFSISAYDLGTAISNTILDLITSQAVSPEIERIDDLGITSGDELNKICEFYGCKYYELDSFLVDYYRENIKE